MEEQTEGPFGALFVLKRAGRGSQRPVGNGPFMKKRLLELLACPDCGGDVIGDFEGELLEGELKCSGCGRLFSVEQGVPNLLPSALNEEAAVVAEQFADQWRHYSERRAEYRQQLLDWLSPVREEFFRGKLVLDGGCGKGRHLLATSDFGPELVVGLDFGGAAYVAKAACADRENVEVVRGDMLCPPFKEGVFDYGYSVGVLHHLPDPRLGFQQLVHSVKPGGHVSAWVYGLENNEWIVRYVDPFRKGVSDKLPRPILRGLSKILAGVLYAAIHGFYRPWHRLFPNIKLPLQAYLLYIARFPHRELEVIVFDQLNPQIAYYLPRQTFEAWFENLDEVAIGWHNENSWRGFARRPESGE